MPLKTGMCVLWCLRSPHRPRLMADRCCKDACGCVGARVVAKAHAGERVGVFARRAGRLEVVEYSELDPDQAAAVDPRAPLFSTRSPLHAAGCFPRASRVTAMRGMRNSLPGSRTGSTHAVADLDAFRQALQTMQSRAWCTASARQRVTPAHRRCVLEPQRDHLTV